MWSDMQKELGDNPIDTRRIRYKAEWVEEHFPGKYIDNDCFLCEYIRQTEGKCYSCPVVWPEEPVGYCCSGDLNYYTMPISQLLALPESEVEE